MAAAAPAIRGAAAEAPVNLRKSRRDKPESDEDCLGLRFFCFFSGRSSTDSLPRTHETAQCKTVKFYIAGGKTIQQGGANFGMWNIEMGESPPFSFVIRLLNKEAEKAVIVRNNRTRVRDIK